MAKLPVGYKSAFKKKASPMKIAWGPIIAAAAPGIISGIGSLFGRKKRRREQRRARKEMQAAKNAYMNMQFENPYADVTNPYAGMENPYQENLYEDLTVDRQGADYLREQQQQSQANIMQGMKGVAGSSGIAGLAQQMSNIGSQQARQASVQISQQERQNEMYRIKGEQAKRQGSFGFEKMMREGDYKTDMIRREGQQKYVTEMEQQRISNMYGLGLDRLSAADSARSTARSGFISGLGQAAAGVAGTFAPGGANYGQEFGWGQKQGLFNTQNNWITGKKRGGFGPTS